MPSSYLPFEFFNRNDILLCIGEKLCRGTYLELICWLNIVEIIVLSLNTFVTRKYTEHRPQSIHQLIIHTELLLHISNFLASYFSPVAKEINITNSLNSAQIPIKIMTETISSFHSLYKYE